MSEKPSTGSVARVEAAAAKAGLPIHVKRMGLGMKRLA